MSSWGSSVPLPLGPPAGRLPGGLEELRGASQHEGHHPALKIDPARPQGYTRPQEFITTQGLLKKTLEDFWQLAWEQQVQVVVMLTVGMESGRVSVPQPPGWPPGGRLSPQDQLWVWEAR